MLKSGFSVIGSKTMYARGCDENSEKQCTCAFDENRDLRSSQSWKQGGERCQKCKVQSVWPVRMPDGAPAPTSLCTHTFWHGLSRMRRATLKRRHYGETVATKSAWTGLRSARLESNRVSTKASQHLQESAYIYIYNKHKLGQASLLAQQ